MGAGEAIILARIENHHKNQNQKLDIIIGQLNALNYNLAQIVGRISQQAEESVLKADQWGFESLCGHASLGKLEKPPDSSSGVCGFESHRGYKWKLAAVEPN